MDAYYAFVKPFQISALETTMYSAVYDIVLDSYVMDEVVKATIHSLVCTIPMKMSLKSMVRTYSLKQDKMK